MRFCMVTTFYPPFHLGGDAVYVQALAQALVRRGHHVEVVHCEDAFRLTGITPAKSPRADSGAGDGVIVHRIKHPLGSFSPLLTQQSGRPGLKGKALAELLGRGFDVIHFHNISLIGGPAILELGRARAKVYTLHDHWLLCSTHILWKNRERACDAPTCISCSLRSGIPPQLWRLGNLLERTLQSVDLMLAPSEFTRRKHHDFGIVRPIEVFPLFSRFTPVAPIARGRLARPLFVFAGRVTASKGIHLLLQLMASMPGYDIVVAGEGDLRAALQRDFRLAPNIRFAGRLGDAELSMLYAGATATIIPSLAPETQSLVALESFAHGVPVITFEAGACGEVVRQAGAGIVCQDIEDMRKAIRTLAQDRALADALGKAGHAAFGERYTERQHVSRYIERMCDLVEHRQAQPLQ